MARPLIEVPGIPPETALLLTRQQRYKLRLAARGTCVSCARRKVAEGKTMCKKCLAKHRERMRGRNSSVRRNTKADSYASVDQMCDAAAPASPRKGRRRARPGKHAESGTAPAPSA